MFLQSHLLKSGNFMKSLNTVNPFKTFTIQVGESLGVAEMNTRAHLKKGRLRFSKISDLKIIQYRPVGGKVKILTVIRGSSGKWYAVFASEWRTSQSLRGSLPWLWILV